MKAATTTEHKLPGLAASRFADEAEPSETATESVPEVAEGEHDSSSAALASVRQPFLYAQFCILLELSHLSTSCCHFTRALDTIMRVERLTLHN